MNLYNSMVTDLLPSSVSQWIKVTTNDEYVVVLKSDILKLGSKVENLETWL